MEHLIKIDALRGLAHRQRQRSRRRVVGSGGEPLKAAGRPVDGLAPGSAAANLLLQRIHLVDQKVDLVVLGVDQLGLVFDEQLDLVEAGL